MTSLPKRGDRVRVTEHFPGSWLTVGNVVTLETDAVSSFGDACEFLYRVPAVHDVYQSGAVKVEILEQASLPSLTPEECARLSAEEQAGFARGMRRAVEIAESQSSQWHRNGGTREAYWAKLKEAVEKELKP